MDHASFQSFIKTILILVLVYYLLKFAFKLLAPYLLHKAVNKVTENFQKQQQAYQNQQTDTSQSNNFETDIKQNKIPKEKKKVGEYIDFEEIE
ncbi:DUF4834 family protein [Myroides sp. JBRI-B21084]|uniref:DUF4834 family protein n=1 Tax=Myroides sp. JBRI-B21084 TaxID=3119977 RepID=UPI0026E1E97D|nr:DUF4834 family protein [Paenimyroides cloacae]WKW45708.1 DUF4834 family protein [Paenimyroides cloacae]